MTVLHFIASTLIWMLLFFPVMLASFVVVPLLLLTDWDGTTTWFGNWKYGRGDTHYKAPSGGVYWKQLVFLCIRNPVSNFGKRVISVQDREWVWLHEIDRGRYGIKFGWKNAVPENLNLRTFIYRPWVKP